MNKPTFKKLNDNWNADPNDPDEKVTVEKDGLTLTFYLNPWAYVADEGEQGCLRFTDVSRWRLGPTNDEGWHSGKCRYSQAAPAWGEFYEVIEANETADELTDWHLSSSDLANKRHFLFYLRDNTFECFASKWRFERIAVRI